MPCCSGSSCWILRELRDLVLSRERTEKDRISTGRPSQRDPPDRDSRERRWMAGEGSGMHAMVAAHPPCEPGWGFWGAAKFLHPARIPVGCVLQVLEVHGVAVRLLLSCSGCWRWGGPGSHDWEIQDPAMETSSV